MFLSGVLFPVVLALSLVIDEGAPMFVPVLIFFVALIMMLYARLFSEDISPIKSQQAQTSGLGAMSDRSALPPASNIPMFGPRNLAGQQVRTAELAQPPSVTENTTKLLDKD
jgi:hypothetical protein